VSTKRKAAPSGGNTLVPHLQELVQSAADELKGVERRRVLASDGWFTNDKLFALVSRQARIVVRLPDEAAAEELLALEGSGHWRIKNRPPFKDWLLLPESMHDDSDAVTTWVTRAWTVARSTQPSAKSKPKRAKTAAAKTKRSRPSRKAASK
jgi:TfoX/Sxy family transcriptional regulator of competence genes